MSRLIDADELIKYIKIWEIGTSISSQRIAENVNL